MLNSLSKEGYPIDLFVFSRLVRLDVKWVGVHKGDRLQEWGHSNPYFEIIMIIDRPVYLQVAGHKLELAPGECLLLKPWQEHRSWKRFDDKASFFWVQFSADPEPLHLNSAHKLPENLHGLSVHQQDLRTEKNVDYEPLLIPNRYRPERRFEIMSLFEKLVSEMKKPHGNFRFRATILFMQILLSLADDYLAHNRLDTVPPSTYLLYRDLVNYLNEHYTLDLNKQMFQWQFQRKYEYLCQVFNKYSGSTIITYIQQLRIQRAKYLLSSSRKDIHEIALEVGFQDPFYFSKVFKRIEGIPPSRFRKS